MSPTAGRGPGDRRVAVCLFCLLACVYVLIGPGKIGGSDTTEMVRLTEAILDGTVSVQHTPGWSIPGPDGRWYSRYPLGYPILLVPFYLGGDAASALAPQYPRRYFSTFAMSLANPLLTAGVGALLYLLLRATGSSPRRAVALALGYAFATGAMPATKTGFTEPMTALLLLAAYLLVRSGGAEDRPGRTLAGWLAFSAAFLTRPLLAVAGPGLLWLAWHSLRAAASRPGLARVGLHAGLAALAVGAGLAAQATYNWARFADVWTTGYEGAGVAFSAAPAPVAAHLLAMLVSPAVGLLTLYPFLALAPLGWTRLRGEAAVDAESCLGLVSPFLAAVACYSHWHTAPRFLLSALPFFFPALGAALDRPVLRGRAGQTVLAACFAAAFALQLPYTLVSPARLLTRHSAGGDTEFDPWALRWAPGVDGWVDVAAVARAPADAPLVYSEDGLPVGDDAEWLRRSASLNSFNFWFVHARRHGVPLVAIVVVSAALASGAVASGLRMRRLLDSGPGVA